MLADERHGGGCGFLTSEGVDDDPSGIPFNDAHIGQIIAADLIDTVHDFEQTMLVVELFLTPETWIHRAGSLTGDEVVSTRIPEDTLVGGSNHDLFFAADLAASGIGKVLRIIERQRCGYGLIVPQRMGRGSRGFAGVLASGRSLLGRGRPAGGLAACHAQHQGREAEDLQ